MKRRQLLWALGSPLLAIAIIAALVPVMLTHGALAGNVAISQATGPVGTVLTVNGTGFSNAAPLSLRFNGAVVQSGTTSITGTFSLNVTVPPVSRGVYAVDAITAAPASDTTAAPPTFTVTPSLSISPNQGFAGTNVTVVGNGYTAAATYSVLFNGLAVPSGTGIVDANGHFSKAVSTDNLPRASYNVMAVTSVAGDSASGGTFIILPRITISPATGVCGSTVNISGTGFAAGQSINFAYDSTDLGTTVASAAGTFTSIPVTIPNSRAGAHVITADDGVVTTDPVTFTVTPKLVVNPIAGGSGDKINLQGIGFGSTKPVSLYWDDALVSSTVTSNSVGSFTVADFTIPVASGGAHTIKALDNTGATASVPFSVGAKLSLSPATGGPGASVTLTGSSFQATKTINVYYNGAIITTSPTKITSNAQGGFTAVVTIPAGPAGPHAVEASDGTRTAGADFITTSRISLDPLTSETAPAYSGDDLTVSGVAFLPYGTITIKVEGVTAPVASATALDDGSFSVKFTVPAVAAGVHKVTAADEGGNSVSASFTMGARVDASPMSGAPGTAVTVNGTGFAAGKTVTFKIGDQALLTNPTTVTADPSGSIVARFVVPGLAAGTRTVTVSDGTRKVLLDFTTTADVIPGKVTSATSPGYVGMQVSVSGVGFSPTSEITITYDNPAVILITAVSDAQGAFTTRVTIPVSAKGSHIITVSDNAVTPVTRQFSFVISTEAPPAPLLSLPDLGVKQGATPTFIWQDITTGDTLLSPGTSPATTAATNGALTPALNLPMTYTMQISLDKNFKTLVLEKKGLSTASYTLTEAEGLTSTGAEVPYYWRVRATDSAGNESPWSTARPFYVGFTFSFEGWVVWLAVALGVIAAFVLGFFVGRGRGGNYKFPSFRRKQRISYE